MEDEGIPDPWNNLHLSALHYVYLNSKLECWRQSWATHQLKSVNSSPTRPWVSDQVDNPTGVSPHEVDAYYGTDGYISVDERDGNEQPIFEIQSLHLSQNCLDQLSESITEDDVKES